MTGIISAVNDEAVANNDGFIVADDADGTFYGMNTLRRTRGFLVGSFQARPLKELMGLRVSFSVNHEGEAYNITVVDNKN